MKEPNFRKLNHLSVPDELMEKLLAIPEAEEKKPAVIPWWRNRAVITAASLVLVSVLSLFIYFFIGNKMSLPVKVKPAAPATEIIRSTDASGETVATEYVVVPDGSAQPTEAKSALQQTIARITGTGDSSPIAAPGIGQHGRTVQTDGMNPTEGKTDPSQSPDTPTQGVEPIEPTQPPTEEPEPVEPTEPYDDPPEPTEPPEEVPIEPPDDPPEPTESPYKDSISDLVYIGEIPEGSVVYCWLYDDISRRRMCEDDAYTAMFYAEVTPRGDGYAFLSYSPKAHGVDLPYAGHYQYLWYLSYDGGYSGRRLYLGNIYLKN